MVAGIEERKLRGAVGEKRENEANTMRNYEERDRAEWNHTIGTIEKKEKEKRNTWRPRRQKAGLPLFLVFSYPI